MWTTNGDSIPTLKLSKAAWLEQEKSELCCGMVELPAKLRLGQVLVQIKYSGVCHSQVMETRGRRGVDPYLPHLLGHEATGVVMEIGPGVTKVKPEDQVILTWIKAEGHDVQGGKAIHKNKVINSGPVTTFSEVTVVSENRVVPLPEGVPLDIGVLFGCALPTGLGMILNELKPEPESSSMVIGLGGVGLCALMGAIAAKCNPVIAVDLSEAKRELALELGATHALDPMGQDISGTVSQLTKGGVDFCIDAAGKCQTIQTAFACIRRGGGRCIFASHPEQGQQLKLDPYELICGKLIQGSWGGACKPDRDVPRFAEMYLAGKLRLDRLIERPYALDQINVALDDLEAGKTMRPIVQMGLHSG